MSTNKYAGKGKNKNKGKKLIFGDKDNEPKNNKQ
jgi:hypothetical protein